MMLAVVGTVYGLGCLFGLIMWGVYVFEEFEDGDERDGVNALKEVWMVPAWPWLAVRAGVRWWRGFRGRLRAADARRSLGDS